MNLEERTERGITIISLEGEADLTSVPLLQSLMRDKAKEGHDSLIVDFGGVTFVNTPVWAVLVEYYQHAHKAGKALLLCSMQDRVMASFNIVRLGDLISHFSTAEEALLEAGAVSS